MSCGIQTVLTPCLPGTDDITQTDILVNSRREPLLKLTLALSEDPYNNSKKLAVKLSVLTTNSFSGQVLFSRELYELLQCDGKLVRYRCSELELLYSSSVFITSEVGRMEKNKGGIDRLRTDKPLGWQGWI
jgi:hypothetical protein